MTINDEILLDAMANDAMGHIALYEWSCGPAGTAGKTFGWSSTTTPRYTAVMPSTPQNNYLCVIRVTDDDEQTAMDTTHITVLLDAPKVTVANDNLLLREGLNIALNASASDLMGSITKREWSCGIASEIMIFENRYPNTIRYGKPLRLLKLIISVSLVLQTMTEILPQIQHEFYFLQKIL